MDRIKLLDIVNTPMVGLDSSNRKSLNCMRIFPDGNGTISVNGFNWIGACSPWLQLVWLIGKLGDLLSWLIIIGEALSISSNEPLINELLPPLLNEQPISYHGDIKDHVSSKG